MTEQQPITFFITFHVDPSKVDEFFTHFRPLYEKVIAEPELRFFHVYQDDENPGKIMLVETWNATKEWILTVQLGKEYYKEYFDKTQPLYVKPREVVVARPVGPPYDITKDGNAYGFK